MIFYGLFVLFWFYFLAGLGIFWGIIALYLSIPETNRHFSPFLVALFLFLSALQAFHAFFGFRAIYAVSREMTGKEIIEVDKTRFVVSIQIFDWKKSRIFAVQKIKNLQILKKPGIFAFEPFWRKRKQYEEKISFDCDEKTYRFGFWLKEKEASEILPIIQKTLDEVKS
jgi:hypothetical protein